MRREERWELPSGHVVVEFPEEITYEDFKFLTQHMALLMAKLQPAPLPVNEQPHTDGPKLVK